MKTPADSIRVQHGHETEEHRALKREVVATLRSCGYEPVICEHLHCDVVAARNLSPAQQMVAVEIERSPRNVLRNLERNFTQGCDAVLIVCPNAETLAVVARRVAHHAPSPAQIAFATPLTLRLLQPLTIAEDNPSEKPEEPA